MISDSYNSLAFAVNFFRNGSFMKALTNFYTLILKFRALMMISSILFACLFNKIALNFKIFQSLAL